jgi:hypothetical protein
LAYGRNCRRGCVRRRFRRACFRLNWSSAQRGIFPGDRGREGVRLRRGRRRHSSAELRSPAHVSKSGQRDYHQTNYVFSSSSPSGVRTLQAAECLLVYPLRIVPGVWHRGRGGVQSGVRERVRERARQRQGSGFGNISSCGRGGLTPAQNLTASAAELVSWGIVVLAGSADRAHEFWICRKIRTG